MEIGIGEIWGYRASVKDRLVAVEVLRIGERKPLRVHVRFLGDDAEGHVEWVSPKRLKAPWAEAEAFEADEARMEKIAAGSDLHDESPEWIAAQHLFDTYVDHEVADLWAPRSPGVARVHDPARMAATCGVALESITDSPLAYARPDGLWVPWAITEKLCQAIADRHQREVLDYVRKEDMESDLKSVFGEVFGTGKSRFYASPEICAEVGTKYVPAREVLRRWVGEPAREQFAELVALRAEVVRLGRLIESAVSELRRAGADEAAQQVENELGIPLDAVREQEAAAQRAVHDLEDRRYAAEPDPWATDGAWDSNAGVRAQPDPGRRGRGYWGRHWSQR